MTNAQIERSPDDRFCVTILRDVRVPVGTSGGSLAADVYLPVTDEPVPALLTLLPYRKDLSRAYASADFRWFAEHGYASVHVDLSGIGDSDAPRRRKFDPDEGADALAVIDWLTRQDWCDGSIGMWGASAGGFTALRAASLRPASLRAIIAMFSPTSPSNEVFMPDGARTDVTQRVHWASRMLIEQMLPSLLTPHDENSQRRWRERLDADPYVLDFAKFGTAGFPLDDRDIDTSRIVTPVLSVGGWRDPYAASATRLYESVQGPRQLLVGPWMHEMPHGAALERIDFLPIALRWWDYWLRGRDNGVDREAPVRVFVQGHRPSWREYASWPPSERAPQRHSSFQLSGSHGAMDLGETGDVARYEPDATIGQESGLWGIPYRSFGQPHDQRMDDWHSVSATAPVLGDDLVVLGTPRVDVDVVVTTSTVLPRIVVKLCDIEPDGRSTLITTGVATRVATGGRVSVALRPTAYCVRAGNSVRVVVSDSDFPRLVPLLNPETFGVAAVHLDLPVSLDDEGDAITIPLAPGGDQPATVVETYNVTRDLIRDSITVTLGYQGNGVALGEHVMDVEAHSEARAFRSNPAATVTTGQERRRFVSLSTGSVIEASATVRCTQDLLSARAELSIDGSQLFTGDWSRPLACEGAGDGHVGSAR